MPLFDTGFILSGRNEAAIDLEVVDEVRHIEGIGILIDDLKTGLHDDDTVLLPNGDAGVLIGGMDGEEGLAHGFSWFWWEGVS